MVREYVAKFDPMINFKLQMPHAIWSSSDLTWRLPSWDDQPENLKVSPYQLFGHLKSDWFPPLYYNEAICFANDEYSEVPSQPEATN